MPVLLGHGGLHALFGVEHHCSHHHNETQNMVVIEELNEQNSTSLGCQTSCCDHNESTAESKCEDEKSDSPVSPPIDEEDCTLCQHVAQGQLISQNVVLESYEFLTRREVAKSSICEVRFVTSHTPRGPPENC